MAKKFLGTPATESTDVVTKGLLDTSIASVPSGAVFQEDPNHPGLYILIQNSSGDGGPYPVASEAQPGIVEIATTAETLAGTDDSRAASPKAVKALTDTKASLIHTHSFNDLTDKPASGSPATETSAGIVELATNAETLAGTDTARATTPANVKAIADTKASLNHTHAYGDLTGQPTIPAAYTNAQAAAAAPVQSVSGRTGTVTLAKIDVGLPNVDNTSDANKPISAAQQSALDLKAPLASPAFTGTPTGITKAHVGLGSVDNTADTAKPVSTAQQAALDAKAPISHTHPASQITDFQAAVQATPGFGSGGGGTAGVSSVNTRTGAVTLSKSDVGLTNVDNTADSAKPISTATQSALDAKASTTHTHTASQISDFNSAAIAAVGTGATAAANPGSMNSPIARFYAGLATRDTSAAYIVFNGDSNTEYGNATNSRSYPSHFAYKIQNEYPLISGAAPIAPTNLAGAGSTAAGIRVVNNGHAGTTSENYLTDSEVSTIAALKPIMVVHAIGTNDAYGRTKAALKANVQSWVTKIKNASTRPTLQVLFLIQARGDITVNLARWKEYAEAYNEIAAADPNNVIFIDGSGPFLRVNAPGADPFTLMSNDKLHPNNAGFALLADTLWGALEPSAAINYVQTFNPSANPTMSTTTAPAVAPTSATVGDTLTVTPGTYSPAPDSRTYQWRRAGTAISGATSTTYVTVTADAGQAITVAETAVKSGYDNLTAVSNAVTPAAASGTTLTNSVAPAVTPTTATTGTTLTTTNGTWSATPDSYTYQWRRAGAAISGATSQSYTTVAADNDNAITVLVTAVKANYTNGTAISNAVTPSATLTNISAPAVTPTSATTGTVLTATNGSWSATPDSYTYQWRRAGAAISGATSSTYTIVTADLSNAITVAVTAIKSGYTSGTAVSNAVTPAASGGGSWTRWTSDGFAGTATTNMLNRATDVEHGGTTKTWKVNYNGGYGVNGSGSLVRGNNTGSYLTSGFAIPATFGLEITVVNLPVTNNEELQFKKADQFGNTYYTIIIDRTGKISLARSITGSVTYGLTSDIPLASGNTIRVEWDDATSVISIYVNGTLRATKDESAVATKPTGLEFALASGANNSVTYDNLKVDTK